MSNTNTIDAALDFMPVDKKNRRPRGVMTSLQDFLASLRTGIEAAHHYERLTAQGTPPQKAVEIVFHDHFADRN